MGSLNIPWVTWKYAGAFKKLLADTLDWITPHSLIKIQYYHRLYIIGFIEYSLHSISVFYSVYQKNDESGTNTVYSLTDSLYGISLFESV